MGSNNKTIKIDNVEYKVHLIDVKRRADTLDKYAYRTEDGVLHRKLIGVYMNYDVTVGIEEDLDLYDTLFDVLSAAKETWSVQLPGENEPQDRYISSVQDGILRVTQEGTLRKDLSFKITCNAPTRKA